MTNKCDFQPFSRHWLTLQGIQYSEYIHPGDGDVGGACKGPGETQHTAEAQHRGAVLHQLAPSVFAHISPAAAPFSPQPPQLEHHQHQQAAVRQHHRARERHCGGVVDRPHLWEVAAQPAPEVKQEEVENKHHAGRATHTQGHRQVYLCSSTFSDRMWLKVLHIINKMKWFKRQETM